MKKYVNIAKSIALSATAKDTFILFGGNTASAFWGFLFTLIVARALSISDFGIFSAANNLAVILISIVDAGVSSGAINFVSEALAKGDKEKADEYIKASLVVRILAVMVAAGLIILLAPIVSQKLLATNNSEIAVLTAILLIFIFPNGVVPYLLQAKKEFMKSVIVDNINFIFRLLAAYILITLGIFKLQYAFWAFFAGFTATIILGLFFLGLNFIKSKPNAQEYKKLLHFSGWIGVNRVLSGISGRLDIQMLAAITGAATTGVYSISSRLAMFIPVLAGSFSSVLAPRMAGFSDIKKQKNYLIKSTLATLPLSLGIIFWVLIAKPFILILFGEKYLTAVPIFQALALSFIPFLITVPAVTFIIYTMKKTIYIGLQSFFQLLLIFGFNYLFIPKYGSLGPTITFAIVNSISAIYSFIIVWKYFKNNRVV